MIYLSSFALSDKKVKNPNLYPYSVFQDKDCDPFVFAPITILYGDNGCGKSTLLNIIAQKINAKGYETYATDSIIYKIMWKNAALIQAKMTLEGIYPFRQAVFT